MANRLKQKLASEISRHVGPGMISASMFNISRIPKTNKFFMKISLDNLEVSEQIKKLSAELKVTSGINNIETKPLRKQCLINFEFNSDLFVKNVLKESIVPFKIKVDKPKNILIEYSSPNIAKPFHVGHLRSTIIGNFLCNINKYMGENVKAMNYLGDWGTQFGLLKTGIDFCQLTPEEIKKNPMDCLYKAYVEANKLLQNDPTIAIKARQIFNELELNESNYQDEWNMYREMTIKELNKMYERLGIKFDEYNWESMYSSKNISPVMTELKEKGIMFTDTDGKKVVNINGKNVTIVKSDGSSLYLGRDIAAAHDRYSKFNFDEMIYVVDYSQAEHFKSLFKILEEMQSPIANRCQLVKFGRIDGMSTRKGTTIFLEDVFNEAKERMKIKQTESKTTKVSLNDDNITDTLGITSVIINDLKQKRVRNYEFSWDRALQNYGDSGIKLQYLHCRLYSIEQNCGFKLPDECRPELITEPEALTLIQELARFEEVIVDSHNKKEACILVIYLFNLGNITNSAINALRVKDRPTEIAEQRLLLFHSTRLVVKRGLEILGIKPLNEM